MNRSIDTILEYFSKIASEKQVISPVEMVDASMYMAILIGDENDKLFDMQQKVAQMKVDFMDSGDNATKARMKVEATDEYKECHKQKAKIEQVEEFIRISKLRARMASNEMNL